MGFFSRKIYDVELQPGMVMFVKGFGQFLDIGDIRTKLETVEFLGNYRSSEYRLQVQNTMMYGLRMNVITPNTPDGLEAVTAIAETMSAEAKTPGQPTGNPDKDSTRLDVKRAYGIDQLVETLGRYHGSEIEEPRIVKLAIKGVDEKLYKGFDKDLLKGTERKD